MTLSRTRQPLPKIGGSSSSRPIIENGGGFVRLRGENRRCGGNSSQMRGILPIPRKMAQPRAQPDEGRRRRATPNLRTNIMAFRGFDSSIININSKGWNSHVHRGFPGKFESSNLSRDNVSREIGRVMSCLASLALPLPQLLSPHLTSPRLAAGHSYGETSIISSYSCLCAMFMSSINCYHLFVLSLYVILVSYY